LTTCLTMISQSYSQTNSNDCIVPCATLKNAVKTKYELERAEMRISILRDSVKKMDKIIFEQDTIISNKNGEISNLKEKVKYTDSISVQNKVRGDFYKSEYDGQVRSKWIAIIIGSVTTVCSLIFF
jgi:hypothetical protein